MVYLIQAGNKIKIGRSWNPFSRSKTIKNASPEKCRLALAFTTENDEASEKALHRHFKDHRLEGEWFEINIATAFKAVIELKLFPEHDSPTLEIPVAEVPPMHPAFENWLIAGLPYDWPQEEIEEVRARFQEQWEARHEEFLRRLRDHYSGNVEKMLAGDRTMSDEEAGEFFASLRGRMKGE